MDTTSMQTMFTLRAATLAARHRTGDDRIATRVHQGRVQVVRVTPAANPKHAAHVEPLSEYVPMADALTHLAVMEA